MRAPVSHRFVRVLVGLGLAGALLLPALAAPARAAEEPARPASRHRPGSRLDEPLPDAARRRLRGLPAHLQPARRLRAGPRARAGLRGRAGSAPPTASPGRSQFRDGLKWSDGTPATAQDACFSWQLAVDAIAAESYIGAGYLDPGLADAGVTKVECPDDTTMIAYTEDASDRILQTYLPIIPKHIWGDKDYLDDRRGEVRGAARRHRPVHARRVADQPVRPLRAQPRTTGARRAQPTRSSSSLLQERRHDGPGAQGRRDRLCPRPQLRAAEGAPVRARASTTVVGSANGWTQLAFNGYGASDGKTIEDGGPSTKALLDPAFRDALGLRGRQGELVERVLGGYGDVGTTIVPPVLGQWHVEPTTPRTFDIELAKQKLDAAGYTLDANGERLDKEGKPISLRLYMPDTDDVVSEGRPVRQGLVRPARRQGDDQRLRLVDARRTSCSRRRRARAELRRVQGRLRHRALGLGRQPGPERPAPDLPLRRHRRLVGQPVLQPRVRRAVRRADSRRPPPRSARRSWPRCRTSSTTRRSTTSCSTTRTWPPTGRTTFAGWQNQPMANGTPLFTYGTLQYTLLTDATARAVADSRAVRRSRRRLGSTHAGARGRRHRTDSGDLRVDLCAVHRRHHRRGRDRARVHLPAPLGPRGRGGDEE